jgi:hypothetical protein
MPDDLVLQLGTTRGALSRYHDPESEAKNAIYVSNRIIVLKRDMYTCRGCFMKTLPVNGADIGKPASYQASGYFDVHHKNSDHNENEEKNLTTVCPFCHEIFHAGYAAHENRMIPIWLPEISHGALNAMLHTLFAVMYWPEHDANSAESIKSAMASSIQSVRKARMGTETAKITLAQMKEHAKAMYAALQARSAMVPAALRQDPRLLGRILGSMDDRKYEMRHRWVGHIRLLPKPEKFERHIQYWVSDQGPWKKLGQPETAWVSAWKTLQEKMPDLF